jgi:DNA-binding CsgD family transcriptional regulator
MSTEDWGDVDRILNEEFFALLLRDHRQVLATLAALPPAWYDEHPRHVMTRAIALSAGAPVPVIDHVSESAFRRWVEGQQSPATRDLVGLLSIRLRRTTALGRYADAAEVADEMIETLRVAKDTSGFYDVLPWVLLRAGDAKLLAARPDDAVSLYAEADRWSRAHGRHPIADYAGNHLALAHALAGRFAFARHELPDAPLTRAEDGTPAYLLEMPGVLAGALNDLAALDRDGATALLDSLEIEELQGRWWWVVAHARTRIALHWGDRYEAVHVIESLLVRNGFHAAPETMAGATLHADLADLHQANGDLQAAQRVLDTPGLDMGLDLVLASAARLDLLRGRPDAALDALAQALGSGSNGPIPARLLVLRAAAEQAATGALDPQLRAAAVAAVRINRAYRALAEAPPGLRDELVAELGDDVPPLPTPFAYAERPRLSRREEEILRALHQHDSVARVASSLHLSPNTVKTHLRALYRKLGVHSRAEALRADGAERVSRRRRGGEAGGEEG